MKNILKISFAAGLMALTIQVPVLGLTISESKVAPKGAAIKQPEHGLLDGKGLNLKNGFGEELTLSINDPTTQLTNIYVKSSDLNSPGAGADLDWTLNLYNITTGHELTDKESGISVTNGDYIDFTVSPTISAKADLIGGDTYAFTITTDKSYYIAGIFKKDESPKNYLPPGVTSEFGVSGNGSGSSLKKYKEGKDWDPVDATYYLKTTCKTSCAPEPGSVGLMLLGGVVALAFRLRKRNVLV
jgi:hypothetical protein